MKCTHCHEKEANTHIKRTINGVTQEMYLCEDCAKELGVMDEFAFEPLSMDNFFGNLWVREFRHSIRLRESTDAQAAEHHSPTLSIRAE